MHAAVDAVGKFSKVSVPLHLRNAPTGLMKGLGYGAEYAYPHDTPEGYVPGVQYLPDELKGARFYHPSSHGVEGKIAARLEMLRSLKPKG